MRMIRKCFNWLVYGHRWIHMDNQTWWHFIFQGHYMYTEASIPRRPGQKARLLTPQYPVVQSPQCLTFYYHMYGGNIGSLNVKVSGWRSCNEGVMVFNATSAIFQLFCGSEWERTDGFCLYNILKYKLHYLLTTFCNNRKGRIYQEMINKNYKPTQKDKHVTKNKKVANTNNNQSE
jgi:hypothetical protein